MAICHESATDATLELVAQDEPGADGDVRRDQFFAGTSVWPEREGGAAAALSIPDSRG